MADTVDVLRDLINTCRDGEKGFQEAANHANKAEFKTMFHNVSQERASFAQELESELAKIAPDKTGKDDGHVVGTLHRAWIDTKTALGAGDQAILEWLEQGEDYAKNRYGEALSKGLPAAALTIVRRQAESVRSVHDRVKTLRDQKAA